MTSIDNLYFSTVNQKIDSAHQLFSRYGSLFAKDPYISKQLAIISTNNYHLVEQMRAMDLHSLCTRCASTEKGGCCSSYMSNETDGILLLINLLMGNSIDKQHEDDEECCFLGPKGCILLPKPFFCLNYNCKAITDMQQESINKLLMVAATVLRSQTELENHLLKIINNDNPGG